MKVLYHSKYARMELDEARGLVRYTRTAEPFGSIDDVVALFEGLASADPGRPRSEFVLLSDVRLAPGRNDEAYETAMSARRDRLFSGFRRRAVLLRTKAGVLQVQRLNRSTGLELRTFDDEQAALAYLLGP